MKALLRQTITGTDQSGLNKGETNFLQTNADSSFLQTDILEGRKKKEMLRDSLSVWLPPPITCLAVSAAQTADKTEESRFLPHRKPGGADTQTHCPGFSLLSLD